LISEHPLFYYSGMIPEYLGGVYSKSQVTLDLKQICARMGIEFVADRVVSLNTDQRSVTTQAGATHSASLMVFDIGGHPPYVPESPSITPVKPLHRLEQIEHQLEELLYGSPTPSAEKHEWVIVGGGAAGAELALNISARVRAHQKQQDFKLTLLEASNRLLRQFPAGLSDHVSEILRQRGVEIRLKRKAQSQSDHQIKLDDQHSIPYDVALWATGTRGQALFANAGLDCDDQNFVWVDQTLQHPQHPWLLAAGDCARINQQPTLGRVGIHAVKQGNTLTENVDRLLHATIEGQPLNDVSLVPFKPYPWAPLILSTGDRQGLWTTDRQWLRGAPFLRLKHFLDLRWIEQYYSRAMPQTTWWEKWHLRNATTSA
jgi:NADH dehydrogenase FAD-containing subunit